MNTNDCPSEARKKGDILVDSLHEERRSAHNNSLSLCIHLNPSQFVFKHTKTVMISVGLEMINAIMSII